MTEVNQVTIEDIIKKQKENYPNCNEKLIRKAYDFANFHHGDQCRKSGEPYMIHPVNVAYILATLELDDETLCAALLHDVVEDTPVTHEDIIREFSEAIAEMVAGVTKLGTLRYTTQEEQQVENYRKMFLAMGKDIRVILIKLADRLHNMRTLKFLSRDRQIANAKETQDLYAPLANRLGIYSLKWELEDLSFKYLHPEEYHEIVTGLDRKREERLKFIEKIQEDLDNQIKDEGIKADVTGRAKHFYSIFRKMYAQNKTIDEIYDLFALRVIVDTVAECYAVLGIVHEMYTPLPMRFKDYIAMPKANNYQSLHTTVVTQFNETFEIQIRTYEMHKIAEYGIAAHWKYKEGKTSGVESDMESKVRWLREVMDAEKDVSGAKEFMDAIRINVFDDEVFVFTPKGDVYDLPVNSTPIDLAYKIHSEVGNHCTGAKVNKKMVTLSTKLQTGDIVELITQQNSRPSLDWLKFVRTSSARSRIRAYFKKEQREENVRRGKDMLERESRRRGYAFYDLMGVKNLSTILQRMTLTTEEDLYANVGFGGLTTNQVLTRLIDEYKREHPIETIEVPIAPVKKK